MPPSPAPSAFPLWTQASSCPNAAAELCLLPAPHCKHLHNHQQLLGSRVLVAVLAICCHHLLTLSWFVISNTIIVSTVLCMCCLQRLPFFVKLWVKATIGITCLKQREIREKEQRAKAREALCTALE